MGYGKIGEILALSAHLEVLVRKAATSIEPIKKKIKRRMKQSGKSEVRPEETRRIRDEVRKNLESSGISSGDIVLIHSSMDGLSALNMQPDEVIHFLRSVFGSDVTIVFATFPLENTRVVEKGKIRKFTPKKALCWTGILPNVFLKEPDVIRSEFPYNTLAAVGPHANKMFLNDRKAFRPHDRETGWYYCVSHHAKILLFGTTSIESNTILDHMAPDIMGDDWPIKDWYDSATYEIKLQDETFLKNIEYQKGMWSVYSAEYKTDKYYKSQGLIRKIDSEISIEIVDDSQLLLNKIIERAREGKLVYQIPKKYWKKR